VALTDNTAAALQNSIDGLNTLRRAEHKILFPMYLSWLARAHAALGQFDDAWRCMGEAMTLIETSKEQWFEAEVNRTAGEIVLPSLGPHSAKAETYFDRALTIARQQQAKSWELRAAMSLARLWRDQGKVRQARELLAPVYGWFTEGFDTRDLKEAKALLGELAA
jgi:predicted ATPase